MTFNLEVRTVNLAHSPVCNFISCNAMVELDNKKLTAEYLYPSHVTFFHYLTCYFVEFKNIKVKFQYQVVLDKILKMRDRNSLHSYSA